MRLTALLRVAVRNPFPPAPILNQCEAVVNLPISQTLLEYVWVDGTRDTLRSKSRSVDKPPAQIKDVPMWNFDGSSTFQADAAKDSDRILKPAAMFKDPFRSGDHRLILCEVLDVENKPLDSNTRASCSELMSSSKVSAEEPWFAFEQEYTLMDQNGWPLGWPEQGYPAPQGPYYGGIGHGKAIGRPLVEAHYRACLHAGVALAGVNSEVMPSQWEFQVGPCIGVSAGDHLWIARYIMHRLCEYYGVVANFHPKPLPEWNGAGNHCNFSTKSMRAPGGIKHILSAIERLKAKQELHIKGYDLSGGEENKERLSGAYETASWKKFTWGYGDRAASIRINRHTQLAGCGYLEDRRPASNCDPYIVCELIARTSLGC